MGKESAPTQRLVGYDLIRILSCVFVMTVHFNAAVCGYAGGLFLYPNEIIPNFWAGGKVYLGTLGNVLFFLLSGASLMLSNREPIHNPAVFYQKRLLSLYPSFWIAFSVAACVDFLSTKGIPAGTPLQLLAALSGLEGYLSQLGLAGAVYYKLGEWFLGAIILLYLIFPGVHRCLNRAPIFTCVVCSGMYIAGLWTIYRNLPHCGYTSLLICLPEMVLGMVYVRYDLRNRPRLSLGICLGTLAVVGLLHRYLMADFLALLMAVSIFLILMVCARWVTSPRVTATLASAAKLTYPLFLVHHWLVYKLVQGFDLSSLPRRYVVLLFLIYLAGSTALSLGLQWAGGRLSGFLRSSRLLLRLASMVTVVGLLAALAGTLVQHPAASAGGVEILTSTANDAQITAVELRENTLIVTAENKGTATWTEEAQYRCGLLINGTDCGIRGCLAPDAAVKPGQWAVFAIELPQISEKGTFQVVMLEEGVAYFCQPQEIGFKEEQP